MELFHQFDGTVEEFVFIGSGKAIAEQQLVVLEGFEVPYPIAYMHEQNRMQCAFFE